MLTTLQAISLHQPWASLVAAGLKRIETRTWETNYRGPIAIHAAKSVPSYVKKIMHDEPALSRALQLAELSPDPNDLPAGAIVGIARLAGTEAINRTIWEYRPDGYPWHIETKSGRELFLSEREIALGNFGSGRTIWHLADALQIEPIETRGYQALWLWRFEREQIRYLNGPIPTDYP